MYTVLLADDERSVLETLRESINWQQFGVDTLLEVSDGLQALKVIETQRVDLLITDILMPHMDGLTLVKTLCKQHPHVHCILLTGHGEFEYAREAIRLNVENYLLKPLNRVELEETIEMALDNLYAPVNYIRMRNGETIFGDNILIRWLNNAISLEELSERANHLDLNLFLPQYCVVCIRKKNESVTVRPFCKALGDLLGKDYEVNFLWDQRGHHLFVLGGHSLDTKYILKCIHQAAADYPSIQQAALCVGEVVHSAAEVSVSYQSACQKLDAADLSPEGCILLECSKGETVQTDALVTRLNSLFQVQDGEARCAQAQLLLQHLNEVMDPAAVFSLLCSALLQLFTQQFPEKDKLRKQLQSRLRMSACASDNDLGEMIDYTYLLYQHAINELSPVVQRAVSYIQERYAQQITIKEYCTMCKMSTPYFGHLFKTETGMFFNNYLNQCRMCSAISLLHETDLKINDIAEKCGFSSPSYFIFCFKKQTGLSPIKYRALQNDQVNIKL